MNTAASTGFSVSIARGVTLLCCGLWSATLLAPYALAAHPAGDETSDDEWFELPLSDLANVRVSELATLTPTTYRNAPAAITRITEEQIFVSGARNLFELLDIYVPGAQWIRHNWEMGHLGVRGIISDREDKVMLRVNGKVMNERTHFGVVSERDFPMMEDIHHIEVIRGAGSAVLGLGAVSMVIDIQTKTGTNVDGGNVSLRAGGVYNFYSAAVQNSWELADESQLYLYAALGNVQGASGDHAPVIYGVDFTTKRGDFVPEGTPLEGPVARDGAQYRDLPPVKLHVQWSGEDTEVWLRYTRAGERQVQDINFLAYGFVEGDDPERAFSEGFMGSGYQQFTLAYESHFYPAPHLQLTGFLSYDLTDYERDVPGLIVEDGSEFFQNHREDEYFGRLLANWHVADGHEWAIGTEFSHEKFGLSSPGKGTNPPFNSRLGFVDDDWTTNTWSLFTEWQWAFSPEWTAFVGARADKNRYTNVLFSPRFSLVWLPDEHNAVKLMLARSLRMNFAEENRAQALEGDDSSRAEKLDSAEVRFERIVSHWQLGVSLFYLELEAIGWDLDLQRSNLIGTQKQWGSELEVERRLDRWHIHFSHAYTKLLDYDENTPGGMITAEPFGFGDDLDNWSNHISKLVVSYHIAPRWNLHSSLRMYWGFPGAEDMRDLRLSNGSVRVSDASDDAYEEQVFLNLGVSHQWSQRIKWSFNAYNLLGWIDKDLNKRLYYATDGHYRSEAAAVAVTLQWQFQ